MSIPIHSLDFDQFGDNLPEQVNIEEIPASDLELIRKRRVEAAANPGVGTPWREALADIERGL